MKSIIPILLLLIPLHAISQVSLIKKNETCMGRKDGSIEVVVTGIDGPFTYLWSNGFKGRIATGLAPGDYSVTVSVAGGCEDVKAAKIWAGSSVSVDISAHLVSVSPTPVPCGVKPSFTYQLTAIPSGGKSPYYCSWGEGGGAMGECTKQVSGTEINETVVLIDSLKCVDSDVWSIKSAKKICPQDPNDITGPDGFGDPQWISVNDEIDYTIRFENDPVFATSNASIVFVTVPIDDDVNPFSFRLSTMGFGNKIIEIPDNTSFYQKRLDYSEDLGFLLDVTSGLDLPNQRFFWLFETIDPLTGQPPTDPFAGFLPVNDTLTGSGEGFINFICSPKSITPTGEFIDHQAAIIFDLNDPLLTNTWSNKIDALPPTTTPGVMPDTFYTNQIPFAWIIQDDPGGSGVHHAELFLAADTSELESTGLLVDTLSTELSLQWGTTYYYSIIGSDNVGNIEASTIDSFYIVPRRSIEFITPDQDHYCIGDTVPIDIVLESITDVDLQISYDSGTTYTLIATSINAWPYLLLLDSSHVGSDIFIKALNTAANLAVLSDPFNVKYLPQIDAGDPVSGCENEILYVEATGANTYLWSPDEIIGNVNGRFSNVYIDSSQYAYVTGTDVFGCSNTDSVFISVYPVSLDSLTQPLCEGDSIFLNNTWVSEEGFYAATLLNGNGCDSTVVTEVFFESPCIWTGGPYVFVDQDATGLNNGTSWSNAFTDLQDALYVAGRYENVQEIWVAEGIYTPHSTRRDTSFVLNDSIKIYGGFLGFELTREERTSNAELVKISGDINIADTLWDNSYHTVRMTNACVDCVMDGLTIQYGYANVLTNAHDIGAGVINAGDGTFQNVIFERNYATDLGAALHSSGVGSLLIVENCTFRLNTSSLGRDLVNIAGANIEFRGANSIQ